MVRRAGIGAEQFDPFLASGVLAGALPHLSSGNSPFGTDINYIGLPGAGQSTGAPAVDLLRAVPFLVQATGIINRIGVNVTAGAGQARVGIYASADNLYPTTLLFDSGPIDTSTGGFKSVACSVPVTVGQILWLVYLAGTSAPTVTTVGAPNGASGFPYASSAAAWAGISVAFAFAALPAAYPAGANLVGAPQPMILVRYA